LALSATQTFRTNLGDKAYDPSPLPKLRWNQQLIGAFIAAAGTGVLIGVYETCWSLLMKAHHATTLEIKGLLALPTIEMEFLQAN